MQTTHVFLYFMCNICLLAYISQCLFSSIHFFLFVHFLYTLHVTLKPIVGPLAHTHSPHYIHVFVCMCLHACACIRVCMYIILFLGRLCFLHRYYTRRRIYYSLLIRLVVGCSLDCNVYFVVKKQKKQ